MRTVPWWAMVSATLAPVFLIGGWTVAEGLQPASYDPARDTISALAGVGATDRGVMTAAFVGLGLCHLVTAAGLGPARSLGRVILGVGGGATVLVAAFPVPADGVANPHRLVASVALAALTLWPALAARRDAPWALRPAMALTATAAMLLLLAVFVAQVAVNGSLIGLTERLLAGVESVWPLVVVLSARTTREIVQSG